MVSRAPATSAISGFAWENGKRGRSKLERSARCVDTGQKARHSTVSIARVANFEDRHLPTVGFTNTGAYDLKIRSGRPNSHVHDDADATADGDVHAPRCADQLLVSFDQESKAALARRRVNRRLNLESITVAPAAWDYDVAALDRDPWPTAADCEALQRTHAGVRASVQFPAFERDT